MIFVLVHGSWHGGWCWYKVVSLLERAGHRAIAPDLPGLGSDKTPIPEVSRPGWVDSVCRVLDAQPEPVVLVGHSRGGIVISEVAEARPEKVRTLVFLCAFLLRDGESLLEVAGADSESRVGPHLVMVEDRGYATFRDEGIEETFYGGCSAEDIALARLLLQPEPLAPLLAPVHVTEARFGSVPRVYVECLRDRAISIAAQRRMHAALPCHRVIAMDEAHSPFFSAPDKLVGHLTTL